MTDILELVERLDKLHAKAKEDLGPLCNVGVVPYDFMSAGRAWLVSNGKLCLNAALLRDVPAEFIAELINAWPQLSAALQAGWVRVEERLPTHIHSVLMRVVADGLVISDTPYTEIGIYNDKRGKWQMNYGDDDIDVSVTHWQPLPAPPEKQNER